MRFKSACSSYFFFFFSSRRRHTRFKCDWSSDVCSSDLALYVIGGCSMFFLAYLRRRLPETKRFQIRHEEVTKLHARIGGGVDLVRRLLREFPGRILLITLVASAWGFAIGPGTVLAASYLQK